MSSLKRLLKRKGPEALTHTAQKPGEIQAAAPGVRNVDPTGEATADPTGQRGPLAAIVADRVRPNLDPLKRRIWDLRRPAWKRWLKRIKKVWRFLFDRPPFRPLTSEEIAIKEEAAYRRQLAKQLREESKLVKRRIQDALARRGICHRYSQSRRSWLESMFKPSIDYVKFDVINETPHAFYLHIDSRLGKLPNGVRLEQLTDPDLLVDLSFSTGMEITLEASDFDRGVWYIVARASGIRAVPGHVKLADMWHAYPASANSLAVPLGMGANNHKVYKSFFKMYSMLVGGTIGAGKSNILNVILCSLIRRNSPDNLKMILVDLKGGLEFQHYEGIPHLLTHIVLTKQKTDDEGEAGEEKELTRTGIIERREDVPDVLLWLVREGEKRLATLKKDGKKNIGDFNRFKKKKKMPHLFFVIDEWGDVKLDPKIGKLSEDRLANIAQRFRAAGIHVIVCTQHPSTKTISNRIKAVLPAKLAFSCTNVHASMAIIGNGQASGLKPAGRFVYQWEGEHVIQAPYIPDSIVKSTVKGAIAGEFDDLASGHDVTLDEILRWALDENSGYLSRDLIYDTFKSRGISHKETTKLLQEIEGDTVMVDGAEYQIEPARGNNARRLVAVNEMEKHE